MAESYGAFALNQTTGFVGAHSCAPLHWQVPVYLGVRFHKWDYTNLVCFDLVLHSHLPYVLAHDRLEEEWLFEAVVESYLPLLRGFEQLTLQGISPKVTVGMTPVLLEQLADPRFALRLVSYLEQKLRTAREDRVFFQKRREPILVRLAGLWEELYRRMTIFFVSDATGGQHRGFEARESFWS